MTVSGSNRVIRGGDWNNDAGNCRAAYRNDNDPGNRNDNIGFRLLSTRRVAGGPCLRMRFARIRLCPGHAPAPIPAIGQIDPRRSVW
ncbi:MAG: SUMF1/EgtB/PvdO family nonheme iron enzyme [bacterium]|nr:SUMF1/EgtB/PvdO family nonheme iron enzyme [bacterium]